MEYNNYHGPHKDLSQCKHVCVVEEIMILWIVHIFSIPTSTILLEKIIKILWRDNYHVIEPQYFVPQEKKSSLEETIKSLNRTFKSFMEFSRSLQNNFKVDHEGQKEEIISGQP